MTVPEHWKRLLLSAPQKSLHLKSTDAQKEPQNILYNPLEKLYYRDDSYNG